MFLEVKKEWKGMEKSFIHETAEIKESQIGSVKVFRNAVINNTFMENGCSIGDDTTIERCKFESNVVINRRSYVNDSVVGKYTYMGINTNMNFTHIGRFCSLGRNVDIGGLSHDYNKVTTMPTFRYKQTKRGGGKIPQVPIHDEFCEIGNDVWIAAGVQIMRRVNVGDGAVIGGGAVVTKDIPPYSIAVGVPAKVIGYRCSKDQIAALEKLKWWNWPEKVLDKHMDELIHNNISDEIITLMQKIYETECEMDNSL